MKTPPSPEEIARIAPGFDLERLARLERSQAIVAHVSAGRPRYNVEAPLGEVVSVAGQRLVSVATS
jgi:hypothetical protein